jgi:tetratricopeptide (TPR) repeat protein
MTQQPQSMQMTIEQALALGWQHHEAGRLAEAESVYRQVLAARPELPEALHLLGVLAMQVGQWQMATEMIQRAIGQRRDFAEAYNSLGNNFQAQGKFEQAIATYRQGLAVRPDLADLYSNLSNALRETGLIEPALEAARRALELRPDFPEACNNLGNALRENGQLDEAIAAFRRAMSLRSGYAEAHYNLGATLLEQDQPDEAMDEFQEALALRPEYPEANYQLGNALRAARRLDEAVDAYRKALGAAPQFVAAHFNLGLTLLLQGNLTDGWKEFEWRWNLPGPRAHLSRFSGQLWRGEPLEGRRLLLHAEQGFGDTIQFVRYAKILAERSGAGAIGGSQGIITLACEKPLQRLLRTVPGIEGVFTPDDVVPEFDVHCPLLSVPSLLGTTVDTIPSDVPYLVADRELALKWRIRIAEDGSLKVGLAWGGRPSHTNDQNRSLKVSSLEPLSGIEGVQLFSLQKRPSPSPGMPGEGRGEGLADLIDWTEELSDFADTAALIENLDLLITVDTAVAHLAGAMGKPVWVLLPFVPDWRWMLDRSDSPWYSTMRLFRQPSPGDWQTPIEQVANALRQKAVENRR